MSAATVAASALVTLAIIQAALRSERFDIYGRNGCNDAGAFIHGLAKNSVSLVSISSNIQSESIQFLKSSESWDKSLDPEILKGLECLYQELKALWDRTNPKKPGYSELNPQEIKQLGLSCWIFHDWWMLVKPVLMSIHSHVHHAETYALIRKYLVFISLAESNMPKVEEGIIKLNPNQIRPIIGVIILIHEYNMDLYEALLIETGIMKAPTSADQHSFSNFKSSYVANSEYFQSLLGDEQ
jgi:hypothetical protein